MTKENAMADIRKVNSKIIRRHRYICGIVPDELKNQTGCGDLFFESPDGQNGELYIELKNLKWRGSFKTEYNWQVSKEGTRIIYSEGDIYIKEN